MAKGFGRISEKIETLLNPCPSVTNAELYELAGFPCRTRKQEMAFQIDCHWSTGDEFDLVSLPPGETRSLPAYAAKQFAKDYAQRGVVLVTEDEDLQEAALRGLYTAAEFFQQAGTEQLAEHRARAAVPDDVWERLRSKYESFYVNEARETLIRAKIEEIEGGSAKAAAQRPSRRSEAAAQGA